ncbi:MAG: stage II sporulation protein R, partial [Firmicutes bacterium]|nr:stage II sporulation protein R [Bacillota bacterium]
MTDCGKKSSIYLQPIKKILSACTAAVAIAAAAWLWYGEESTAATVYNGNLIRLHVIANSDAPADQALKMMVRDEIIRTMSPVFAGIE